MSDTKTQASSGGISFGGLLTIVFITLKLCHVIDWSWWWVLSPLWISLGLVLVFLGGLLAFAGTVFVITTIIDWRQAKKFRTGSGR
jgi:hypothetical protein